MCGDYGSGHGFGYIEDKLVKMSDLKDVRIQALALFRDFDLKDYTLGSKYCEDLKRSACLDSEEWKDLCIEII